MLIIMKYLFFILNIPIILMLIYRLKCILQNTPFGIDYLMIKSARDENRIGFCVIKMDFFERK